MQKKFDQDLLEIKSKEDLYRFQLLTGGDASDPNAYVRTLEKKTYRLFRLSIWLFLCVTFYYFFYFKLIPANLYFISLLTIILYFTFCSVYGAYCLRKGYSNFWMDHSKKKYTTRIVCERYAERSNFFLIDAIGAGFFLVFVYVIRLIGE